MKFKNVFIIVIILLLAFHINAQITPVNKKKRERNISCDCNNAVKIKIDKSKTYGPTLDSLGFGKIQEIPKKSKNSKFYFEKEHNTAWYLLNVELSGKLLFDIIPKDTTNDLDFILFIKKDTSFCNDFKKMNLVPIRSNIARNNKNGNTGLNLFALNDYAKEGVGNNYSKYLDVNENDQLVLVIDNVSKQAKGHTLKINVVKDVKINGKVTVENEKPLVAEISLTNEKGKIIEELNTDTDGNYLIESVLNVGENYFLNIYHDSTFIKSEIVIPNKPETYTNKKSPLEFLKIGKKYKFENLIFYGGSFELVPQSKPTLDHLLRLLKKNQKLTIAIEGHVNNAKNNLGIPKGNKTEMQELSENRADEVKKYLVKKGIDTKRLQTKGFGDTQMLFPVTNKEEEFEQNRRVEIRVLSK